MKRIFVMLCGVGTAVALLVPWWRNHALLVDFCDYGLVMAAVGRMELGDRPYVDFITPIQTLQFLAGYFSEKIWGARYLSLTYLNGVFIVASFAALVGLLRRRLGAALAILLAASVVAASAVQHTIIWYNAMGVVWLALVACAAAQLEADPGQRSRAVKLAVILGALWLCGMTKVTYQIAALAFACSFELRAAWTKMVSWRTAVVVLTSYLIAGIALPVVTELLYTGATLHQWLQNVVLLSGASRTALLGQMATWQFYVQTPHDYYHPLRFTFVGAWGVVLVLLVAGAIVHRSCRAKEGRTRMLVTLGGLAGGAWICGGVLLATNMEIAYLAGAAWLALACSLALGFAERGGTRVPGAYRIVLAIGALTLLLPAWEAAWKGTRALWGHEPLVRSQMVPATDLGKEFRYLRGMQIVPSMRDSLEQFAAVRSTLVARGISPRSFYFTNATEWMVRVVPEARHTGLPLWLASGTTVVDSNAESLAAWLSRSDGAGVIFSSAPWDFWFVALQKVLQRDFFESASGQLRIYERRRVPEPIQFALATESNVYSQGMVVRSGTLTLQPLHDGRILYGGEESHQVDLNYSLYRLTGEMVGEFEPMSGPAKAEATLRIFARDGTVAQPLWEERIDLTGPERTFSRRFAVSTGGRPVQLRLDVPADFKGRAGWRALKSEHSGPLLPDASWPMDARLLRKNLDDALLQALFSDQANVSRVEAFGRSFRINQSPAGERWLATEDASEIWFRTDHASQVSGEFVLPETGWKKGGVRVSVICYKSGRFDVLYRADLSPGDHPSDRAVVPVRISLPEGMGWIGLVAAPLGAELHGGDVQWRNFRVW